MAGVGGWGGGAVHIIIVRGRERKRERGPYRYLTLFAFDNYSSFREVNENIFYCGKASDHLCEFVVTFVVEKYMYING